MATDIIKRIPNLIDTSLRPAIDLLSQPVFLVDLSDQIIIANNAAQTTTGLQESALVGNPIATILSLNGRPEATSDKSALGSLISVPATIHAMKYTATFVSLSDLTYFAELTPRPAALVILTPLWSPQMQDQTTATIYEQFIGNLTLRITHDLSNSFTSIMMNAKLVHEVLNDLLQSQPDQCASLTDSGLPEIRDVIRKIREMAEFTKTLRDYAGQPPVNTHTLDLNTAISETLSIANTLLGGKIQIEFLPSIELPPIYIDRFRVDRILLSILLSCRKAMPSGGSIVIKTGRTTLDQEFSLTHSGARPGTYTVLSIEDSSPGMDSERVTRVFDLPTSEIFDSSSLSLPIVYSIVKRFGGYITVKSPSGQGTTFDIYFPSIPTPPSTFAPPDEVDNERSQSHEAPGPTHASLILVADDDRDIQQTIARYLSRELPGYHTTFAGDGETTLSLYRQLTDEGNQPALLIADLGLPKMNGGTLALKVQEQFSSALILLTSGHPIETNPITATTHDGFHFLQKPFEPDAFITTIKRLLKHENER